MVGFPLESRAEDVVLKEPYATFWLREHLQPPIHIGGRYYLSTTSGPISSSSGAVKL